MAKAAVAANSTTAHVATSAAACASTAGTAAAIGNRAAIAASCGAAAHSATRGTIANRPTADCRTSPKSSLTKLAATARQATMDRTGSENILILIADLIRAPESLRADRATAYFLACDKAQAAVLIHGRVGDVRHALHA